MSIAKVDFKSSVKNFLNFLSPVDRLMKLTGAKKIHCLGDSHTTAFQYMSKNRAWFHTQFSFCIVKGATALGLANPKSKTNALKIFQEYICLLSKDESLLFCLGEVDCGFLIWLLAQKNNCSIEEKFELSLHNYLSFLKKIKEQGFQNILICTAPLPTILDNQDWGEVAELRREVKATLKQRTDLTREYNKRLREYCDQENYLFLDLEKDILDINTGVINDKFRYPNPLNHHLNDQEISPLLSSHLRTCGYW